MHYIYNLLHSLHHSVGLMSDSCKSACCQLSHCFIFMCSYVLISQTLVGHGPREVEISFLLPMMLAVIHTYNALRVKLIVQARRQRVARPICMLLCSSSIALSVCAL